ncbi:hypothetical protein PEX1_019350 [Penicillium expansum]|uniref:Uncharacterized protein n=1 Tax=Penicillium expansum TaxID=27334 RepID=A0A0A2I5U2_PENEN|nr:hypothetical protein PEX2_105520 [Penicillium expansum]KGO37731.1 hypothetical protein PEXP_077470 [Penicillium expansum]KGO49918.1 hypothetical protein PEX2_105520 [Penicillium expansum]KGO57657.1 hypothetical protein PEX1_019350 [Penicillium expansum]
MAKSSDEEADSRTALVGAPRTRSNPRSTSRSASHDSSRPAKRQRRNRNKKDSDLADFVPKGVAFSATSLPVDDPDNTSSSGSSSASSEDSDSDADKTTVANPHAGNTAPAISWNQGRKAAVRTTLGKRSAPTNEQPTQFEAVNDKYWRSRSASVSVNGEDKPTTNDQFQNDDELEDGEIDSKSDTDDTDSLGSEADDSILLNIGDKMGMDGANDYDPATLAHQHASTTGNSNLKGASAQTGPGSKEEAFRLFSIKYPNAPVALVDLSQADLEILANVNTAVPGISTKAVFAPTGDDANDAANVATTSRNAVQNYAISHTKCLVTIVGMSTWKLNAILYGGFQSGISTPTKSQSQSAVPIAASSSFTLKGIDPDMITNLNTVIPPRESRPPSQASSRGRNRGWSPAPSPEEDDMMSRVSRGRGRPVPAPRGNTRGSIKFASGVGSKRGGDPPPRGPSRGRSTFSGNNNHRARSPNPPLPRGPPPPRGGGRGRGPQRGGGFSRGPRGGGGRGRGW